MAIYIQKRERVQVYVNGVFSGGLTNTAKFSLYVGPYLVAVPGKSTQLIEHTPKITITGDCGNEAGMVFS